MNLPPAPNPQLIGFCSLISDGTGLTDMTSNERELIEFCVVNVPTVTLPKITTQDTRAMVSPASVVRRDR